MIDLEIMELQRSNDEDKQRSTESTGTPSTHASTVDTTCTAEAHHRDDCRESPDRIFSTTTPDGVSDELSDEEEVQQLLWEERCLAWAVEEATHDDEHDQYKAQEYGPKVQHTAAGQSPSSRYNDVCCA